MDAICTDDGEEVVPALVAALDRGRPLTEVPALRLRTRDGWVSTPPLAERTGLDRVPSPARELVARYRNQYHCLLFKPVWLVEMKGTKPSFVKTITPAYVPPTVK